ncbi:MAG: type II secretion system F family protein [Rickettsiales bacterium]
MPSYKYSSINDRGRTIRGVVVADNEIDLENRLKDIGLDLISAREVKTRDKSAGRGTKVKNKDLIVMCLHLEQLDRAGVPLHDAIADVRDSTESAKLKDVLTGVYESVKTGTVFSKALEAYPRVFNNVFVGLIAAGEKTGDLAMSFQNLGEHLKWVADLRRKVKKAIRYPIVLLVVLSLVITALMILTVPKMVEFIVSQGFELPIHTRALIAVSEAFQSYWYAILGIPVVIFFIFMLLYNISERFAYRVDYITLKIPLIGSVSRKIDMARFANFFAIMFNSGIDVIDSLEAAKGVISNRVLKESIDLVKVNVTDGNSITSSLLLSHQFPNLVIRMFKVGEDSGNLKDALENIKFFYNREVSDAVDNLVGSIQPILTTIMGLIIAWIIAAVFGPLYESFSKLNI